MMDVGLWYPYNTTSEIVGYSDANWDGNVEDLESISGGCFYIDNNLVFWHIKKQNSISLLTVEDEYIHQVVGALNSSG